MKPQDETTELRSAEKMEQDGDKRYVAKFVTDDGKETVYSGWIKQGDSGTWTGVSDDGSAVLMNTFPGDLLSE